MQRGTDRHITAPARRRKSLAWGLALAISAGAAHAGPQGNEVLLVLDKASLVAVRPDGRRVGGERLAGSVLSLRIQGVAASRVRIDRVRADPDDASGDILLYELSDARAGGGPVCAPDAQGIAAAVAVAGTWSMQGGRVSADGITMACTSDAMGKCLRWGYRHWLKTPAGAPMLDHYTACTRAVTADYCGAGRGHTRDGTLIDIYDKAGVQAPAPDGKLAFEAGFSPAGAVCIAKPRLDRDTLEETIAACPAKLAASSGPQRCTEGAAAAAGALVFIRSR